jgi:hypothetical protein
MKNYKITFSNINFFCLVNCKLFWYEASLIIMYVKYFKDMSIQSFQNFEASNLMWSQAHEHMMLFKKSIYLYYEGKILLIYLGILALAYSLLKEIKLHIHNLFHLKS